MRGCPGGVTPVTPPDYRPDRRVRRDRAHRPMWGSGHLTPVRRPSGPQQIRAVRLPRSGSDPALGARGCRSPVARRTSPSSRCGSDGHRRGGPAGIRTPATAGRPRVRGTAPDGRHGPDAGRRARVQAGSMSAPIVIHRPSATGGRRPASHRPGADRRPRPRRSRRRGIPASGRPARRGPIAGRLLLGAVARRQGTPVRGGVAAGSVSASTDGTGDRCIVMSDMTRQRPGAGPPIRVRRCRPVGAAGRAGRGLRQVAQAGEGVLDEPVGRVAAASSLAVASAREWPDEPGRRRRAGVPDVTVRQEKRWPALGLLDDRIGG